MKRLLIFVFALFFLVPFVFSTDITDCGNLTINEGNYVLLNSITSAGDCLVIQNESIAIDCNGFTITGYINTTVVLANSFSGLNITDCNINGSIITEGYNNNSGITDGTNGGSIFINNSNVSGITEASGADAFCGTDCTKNGGAGGAITILNSNATIIHSHGGNAHPATSGDGGNGGTINITNSIVSTIVSSGGNCGYSSGDGTCGNGGAITILNSKVTTISNNAGAASGGIAGNANSITITNSNATSISSIGSSGYDGGNGGNLIITNSNTTTINNYGGNAGGNAGGESAGDGGYVLITNSSVSAIDCRGGSSTCTSVDNCVGGSAGFVSILNSNTTTITANGGLGSGQTTAGNGGNGGNLNISYSSLNLSVITINLIGGNGLAKGINGVFKLNQTLFYNQYGITKFDYINTTNTTLSTIISITKNSSYINSTFYPSYNVSGNITLNDLSTAYMIPKIYRGGTVECNETTTPTCWNFTSLNAGTVRFNVSSWSSYSIVETNITIPSPTITSTNLTGAARIVSVDLLSIFVALIPFGCILLFLLNENYKRWGVEQWIFWMIVSIVCIVLISILLPIIGSMN